jgi:flagellar motor component MotA
MVMRNFVGFILKLVIGIAVLWGLIAGLGSISDHSPTANLGIGVAVLLVGGFLGYIMFEA